MNDHALSITITWPSADEIDLALSEAAEALWRLHSLGDALKQKVRDNAIRKIHTARCIIDNAKADKKLAEFIAAQQPLGEPFSAILHASLPGLYVTEPDNKPDISKSQSVTDRHELIENHNKSTDVEQEESGQESGQKLNSALHKEENK